MSKARLLRAAERRAQAWKNGGGTTREVTAFPPGSSLDDFDWRISIADVMDGGAFSRFEGVDRIITILSGMLDLEVDGRTVRLTPADAPHAFAGDAPTIGAPVAGPVRDLNVMVRRSGVKATVERAGEGAIIAIDGRHMFVAVALTPAWIVLDGQPVQLAEQDAVMIDAGGETEMLSVAIGALCVIRIGYP
ncbi:HutD family protein [Sphingobium sp.]|uniref:HutD/Ves family protein n=1 Tax=Sphingobium sp. TaxID=1912891 RepID=UPI002C880A69|nr:HutD family protein [Sphingobium sp.]HUD93003.1 HutD family protein [Sphingobium sp.]